ncbi:ribonuclease HII [Georgenia sp. TF02-10]|uniref:ribonuclease HII n=1 Tax=Georgenia sp. TF02-10 TaxID=2917725 RepID=UPI00352CC033
MTPPRRSRPAGPGRAARAPRRPTRSLERALLAEHGAGALVAGMDEVGRGALAGPVSVGVAVVDARTSRRMPPGLADSKQLTPRAREDLVEPVRAWCAAAAVGHASPAEIDAHGIIAALRLAGRRALAELAAAGVLPAVVILDGSHDWLSEPADLLGPLEAAVPVPGTDRAVPVPPVRTQVKADAGCAVVAAASVLAKVTRDRLMVTLHEDHPGYGWAGNKGYASPEHVAALGAHGPCPLHRRSWHLPGTADPDGAADEAAEIAELQEAGPALVADDPWAEEHDRPLDAVAGDPWGEEHDGAPDLAGAAPPPAGEDGPEAAADGEPDGAADGEPDRVACGEPDAAGGEDGAGSAAADASGRPSLRVLAGAHRAGGMMDS